MRPGIVALVFLLMFAGCKSRPSSPATAQVVQTDTTYLPGGSEKLYASKWVFTELNAKPFATANGQEPAHLLFFPGQSTRVSGSTGCNRLSGTVALGADNALGFSPLATTKRLCTNGSHQEQDLLSALQGVTHFYVVDSNLLLLKNKLVVAKLSPEEASTSTPNEPPMNDEQLRNLNEELLSGIDFKASGNEPFWSLDVDRKRWMRFRLASGDSIITPAVKPVRLQDVAASSYRAQTEKGLLTVVVYDKPCVNSMSGFSLPKTVIVTWDKKKYEGCGTYLSDYRLNDIWVLKSLNNAAIDAKKLMKGAPQLEINLKEQSVTGHTGCNGFGGRVEVTGRYISFLRLNGTMMACDDGGFETRYYKLLAVPDIEYEINDGLLTLRAGSNMLRYQKVD